MVTAVLVIVGLFLCAGLLAVLGNIAYGILEELRTLNESFDTAATRDRWRIAVQKVPREDWTRSTRE